MIERAPTRSWPLALSLAFALSAPAVRAADPSPAHASPANDIARFFSGRTEGLGSLKVIMHRAVNVSVHGTGRTDPDGSLVLSQIVNEGDKPARTRTWRIREITPGRFSGTLSDARGPVTLDRAGGRLHIAFTGIDGNGYEQWLTFAPDGRSAHNTLEVRKYGMTVANLDETIRKLD